MQIQAELEYKLEAASREPNPIKRFTGSLLIVETSIKELLTFIRSYTFESSAEEVNYFKHVAPYFYCLYLYYRKLQDLEILKRFGTTDNTKLALQNELAEMNKFTNDNKEFLAKYFQVSVEQDEQLFTRANDPANNWILQRYDPVVENNFSPASKTVGTMLAAEKLRHCIDAELKELDQPTKDLEPTVLQKYSWAGAPKAAAWELFNRLAEKKIIYYEGMPADKKQVAEWVRLSLNVDLGNIYEVDRKNRSRKKEKLPFLKSLAEDSSPIDPT